MIKTTEKLKALIKQVNAYISESSDEVLSEKLNPDKWSKKEILGHLIDSGINNLQRFTEIQFEEQPYQLRGYKQDELVRANDYQNADANNILDLLIAINNRIIDLMKLQTEETLQYKIVSSENDGFDLKYLMEDYVAHFEHHALQIIE